MGFYNIIPKLFICHRACSQKEKVFYHSLTKERGFSNMIFQNRTVIFNVIILEKGYNGP
jgi:hypothetical protein